MNIEDIKNGYYFETLTKSHDLSSFDCGDDDLNDFLRNDALTQQKEKLNVTKVIIYNEKIIGFVTILTDTLILKNINDKKLKLKIKGKLGIKSKNREISAAKIGRLAIDKNYSNRGLGSHILRSILKNLKEISENKIGFRFIIIEGYAKAFNFYVIKNSFEYLKKYEKTIQKINFIKNRHTTKTFYLYLDLEKI